MRFISAINAFVGQREIACRGKLVEVKVFVPRLFQRELRFPEFLCLHLKFNLVYPEFMDEFFRGLPREVGRNLPRA
ncbi:MAG: hypothetical protein NTV84_02910 [Methanoregula sp.]|nr:hypothetical protein [Methanoregula sp.]